MNLGVSACNEETSTRDAEASSRVSRETSAREELTLNTTRAILPHSIKRLHEESRK